MLRASDSPDVIGGIASPGVPPPGLTWDARLRRLVTALEARVPGAAGHAEHSEIQRHAVFGARLVASLGDVELIAIVRHHHERIDGSGYPDGLREIDIPLGSRILAVTDTFDALTSSRPYREAFSAGAAIGLLEDAAGRTLDPRSVTAFLA